MIMSLPNTIDTVAQLEELLSRPFPALVQAMAELSGDILCLGAGGKIGPSLARMAQRAAEEAGVAKRIIAVARRPLPALAAAGVETLQCDLMDREAVSRLPRTENVVYLVGRKFGSTGNEALTWMTNVVLPHQVASTLADSRIVVFSTGCVYPVVHLTTGGSVEWDSPEPVGEYAMSCLGRERVFEQASAQGTPVALVRLNYAVELRYGVLHDIASRVLRGEPVDVTTGYVNVMWQGDVCDQVLRSLPLAGSPPLVLNLTGPETLSVRRLADRFGRLLGVAPIVCGEENGYGYLSDATRANALFGNPRVPVGKVVEWAAAWLQRGGESLAKPTHYEAQDGRY